jgi:hypothetical protein
VGECSATAGETAAGSVQDDVRSDGHQIDGSSRVGDEEGGAFNAHPSGGGSADWITLTRATGPTSGPSTAKRVRHFGNAPDPKATAAMNKDGKLWRRSRLRQVKYLNNIVEQDHRNVKRLPRPGLGFGAFWTARRTRAGYEPVAIMRKGQVPIIGGRDIRTQATFIVGLFQVGA